LTVITSHDVYVNRHTEIQMYLAQILVDDIL